MKLHLIPPQRQNQLIFNSNYLIIKGLYQRNTLGYVEHMATELSNKLRYIIELQMALDWIKFSS